MRPWRCTDFGLGPRASSIAVVASDPRGALLAELDRPRAGQIDNPSLQTSGAANRTVFENNAKQLAEQKLAKKKRDENPGMQEPAMEPEPKQKIGQKKGPPPLPQQIFLSEAKRALRRRARRRDRLCRAAGLVLVEPFLRLGRQDQ